MPTTKTKAELEMELDEANERIEELESKLEEIVTIADPDSDDEEGREKKMTSKTTVILTTWTDSGPPVQTGVAQGSARSH